MKDQPVFIGCDYGEEQSVEVDFRVNPDGSVTITDMRQWKATIELEPENAKKAGTAPKDSAG